MDDLRGYHVYLDSAGVVSRVTSAPILKAEIVVPDLPRRHSGADISYRLGVTSVDSSWVESSKTWSSGGLASGWEEKDGWPKRMPKGSVASVVPADFDGDGEYEIVAAGQVIAIWTQDGSSATGNANGLLYDPYASASFDDEALTFQGEIAVGDLDDDGELEIVGCYGDNKIYALEDDGQLESGFPVSFDGATSGPVLANLNHNDDDYLEIIVQSYTDGDVYVFDYTGSGYSSNTGGVFASPSTHSTLPSDNFYVFHSLAVAEVSDTATDELAIIQATRAGTVYAWKGLASQSGNPPTWWALDFGTTLVSTPVMADVDDDSVKEVVLRTRSGYYQVTMIEPGESFSGNRIRRIWGSPDPAHEEIEWSPDKGFIPPVAVGDLGGESSLDIVACQGFSDSTDSYSAENWATVCYLQGVNEDSYWKRAVGEIRVPARRGKKYSATITPAVIADIDDDSNMEFLVGSDHGAIFAFEPTWDGNDRISSISVEPGWPLIFADNPQSPLVLDVDDDNMMELIGILQRQYEDLSRLVASRTDPPNARGRGHTYRGGVICGGCFKPFQHRGEKFRCKRLLLCGDGRERPDSLLSNHRVGVNCYPPQFGHGQLSDLRERHGRSIRDGRIRVPQRRAERADCLLRRGTDLAESSHCLQSGWRAAISQLV